MMTAALLTVEKLLPKHGPPAHGRPVKELRKMSSFGDSEEAALDNTAEMIRGYIRSMEAQHKRIPLPAAKLTDLKQLLRIN
jgi:predicted RNase H-like HicB family nuclease